MLAWRNDERIRVHFVDSSEICESDHLEFAKKLKDMHDRKRFLAINGDERIGVCYLTNIDMSAKECELGLYINPFSQEKGKGSLMMSRLLDECHNMGMRRVWLKVFASNDRAIWLYRKFGFCELDNQDGLILMSLTL